MCADVVKNLLCSGVSFGTSGLRGLSDSITDRVAYGCAKGFLQVCVKKYGCINKVAVAGDLRPSSPRIMHAVSSAIRDVGACALNMGFVPSPALALYGLANHCPTIMVTGSHIPEDRNGIKFTSPDGEITKAHEEAILNEVVEIPCELSDIVSSTFCVDDLFNSVPLQHEARDMYIDRYLSIFPSDFLSGVSLGVYEHSAVGRDLLSVIYAELGAKVAGFGRSDSFVPVDTEAIRAEDYAIAASWARDHHCDSIVSTDGDSDRPLISDEHGVWLRGDVCGVLTALYLGAKNIVTPVSCNSVVEKCGGFQNVWRTRIGSPYVIEGIENGKAQGAKDVVGYEANGGFLIGSDIQIFNKVLSALPTRDAVIVHLCVLGGARHLNIPISDLVSSLPARFTASDRIKDFANEQSARVLNLLISDSGILTKKFGRLDTQKPVDKTDGLRFSFENGDVVHFRPSGNAPEFRCYAEATTEAHAKQLVVEGLELASSL